MASVGRCLVNAPYSTIANKPDCIQERRLTRSIRTKQNIEIMSFDFYIRQ